MPHCPVTVVQRYRDEVCSLLFHLFFIICHPYIPLHLEEMVRAVDQPLPIIYIDTCVGGSKLERTAVERGRLWSMADRTWQIEHRGEFRLALRRATSLPRGNQRDYVSYKTLVYTMAFCLCFTWQRSWLLVHRPTRAPPSWSMYRRHSRMPRKPRAAVVQL